MEHESIYRSLWRDLRSPEPHLIVRMVLSLVTGLMLTAVGVTAAWVFAHLRGANYVRDEHIGVALFLAGLCWCVVLLVIWSPVRHGRQFVAPAIATVALGGTTIAGMIAIDEWLSGNEELLMGAVALLGIAAALLVWLPTIYRALRGRPVVNQENQVLVNCPDCGYSLIGLRDLRCPECGRTFTIDELIRAQGYGGVRYAERDDLPADPPRIADEPVAGPTSPAASRINTSARQ
ncbi:MAG: hypothetical protein KKB50_15005 [Planctomycetes bacterium]|nr:hypothetical protein [Planctomycetota bacterium]